jgi:DNA-binding LytR/AlgR family response regulator
MEPVSVLIVEDKVIIAAALAETLATAGYRVMQQVTSGESALEAVRENRPDVILMDIHLAGEMDGIQTVERLNEKYSIPVIYLTDLHDEETIGRAKHTLPAAFLLKPFKAQDLLIAIEIAFYNASNNRKAIPQRGERTDETFFPLSDRVFLKDKDLMHRIDLDDILWIEASGSYCKVQTTGKVYTLAKSMKAFSEKFSHPLLVRVHRGFVVNIDKVTAIKGTMLMIGAQEIPTSETYREELHKRFPMI